MTNKKRFAIWNNSGVLYAVFYATNRKAAVKQANRNGYYIRNGFKIVECWEEV